MDLVLELGSDQLDVLRKTFLANRGLSLLEFVDTMLQLLPSSHGSVDRLRSVIDLEDAFAQIDVNGDEKLDYDEFMAALIEHGASNLQHNARLASHAWTEQHELTRSIPSGKISRVRHFPELGLLAVCEAGRSSVALYNALGPDDPAEHGLYCLGEITTAVAGLTDGGEVFDVCYDSEFQVLIVSVGDFSLQFYDVRQLVGRPMLQNVAPDTATEGARAALIALQARQSNAMNPGVAAVLRAPSGKSPKSGGGNGGGNGPASAKKVPSSPPRPNHQREPKWTSSGAAAAVAATLSPKPARAWTFVHRMHVPAPQRLLLWLPDVSILLSSGLSPDLLAWHVSMTRGAWGDLDVSVSRRGLLRAHTSDISDMVYLRDIGLVASTGLDAAVCFWAVRGMPDGVGGRRGVILGGTDGIESQHITGTGSTTSASGGSKQQLLTPSTAASSKASSSSNATHSSTSTVDGITLRARHSGVHSRGVRCLLYMPTVRLLFSGGFEGHIQVWDMLLDDGTPSYQLSLRAMSARLTNGAGVASGSSTIVSLASLEPHGAEFDLRVHKALLAGADASDPVFAEARGRLVHYAQFVSVDDRGVFAWWDASRDTALLDMHRCLQVWTPQSALISGQPFSARGVVALRVPAPQATHASRGTAACASLSPWDEDDSTDGGAALQQREQQQQQQQLQQQPATTAVGTALLLAVGTRLKCFEAIKTEDDFVIATGVLYQHVTMSFITVLRSDIRAYDACTGILSRVHRSALPSDATVGCFVLDGRSRKLLVGCNSGAIIVLNAFTMKAIKALPHHRGEVSGLIYVKHDNTVISTGFDGTLLIADELLPGDEDSSHALLRRVRHAHGPGVPITSCAFDYQVSIIATGTGMGEIRLWDYQDVMHLGTLKGHAAEVSCMTFASPWPVLVSADTSGLINVWQVAAGSRAFPCLATIVHNPSPSSNGPFGAAVLLDGMHTPSSVAASRSLHVLLQELGVTSATSSTDMLHHLNRIHRATAGTAAAATGAGESITTLCLIPGCSSSDPHSSAESETKARLNRCKGRGGKGREKTRVADPAEEQEEGTQAPPQVPPSIAVGDDAGRITVYPLAAVLGEQALVFPCEGPPIVQWRTSDPVPSQKLSPSSSSSSPSSHQLLPTHGASSSSSSPSSSSHQLVGGGGGGTAGVRSPSSTPSALFMRGSILPVVEARAPPSVPTYNARRTFRRKGGGRLTEDAPSSLAGLQLHGSGGLAADGAAAESPPSLGGGCSPSTSITSAIATPKTGAFNSGASATDGNRPAGRLGQTSSTSSTSSSSNSNRGNISSLKCRADTAVDMTTTALDVPTPAPTDEDSSDGETTDAEAAAAATLPINTGRSSLLSAHAGATSSRSAAGASRSSGPSTLPLLAVLVGLQVRPNVSVNAHGKLIRSTATLPARPPSRSSGPGGEKERRPSTVIIDVPGRWEGTPIRGLTVVDTKELKCIASTGDDGTVAIVSWTGTPMAHMKAGSGVIVNRRLAAPDLSEDSNNAVSKEHDHASRVEHDHPDLAEVEQPEAGEGSSGSTPDICGNSSDAHGGASSLCIGNNDNSSTAGVVAGDDNDEGTMPLSHCTYRPLSAKNAIAAPQPTLTESSNFWSVPIDRLAREASLAASAFGIMQELDDGEKQAAAVDAAIRTGSVGALGYEVVKEVETRRRRSSVVASSLYAEPEERAKIVTEVVLNRARRASSTGGMVPTGTGSRDEQTREASLNPGSEAADDSDEAAAHAWRSSGLDGRFKLIGQLLGVKTWIESSTDKAIAAAKLTAAAEFASRHKAEPHGNAGSASITLPSSSSSSSSSSSEGCAQSHSMKQVSDDSAVQTLMELAATEAAETAARAAGGPSNGGPLTSSDTFSSPSSSLLPSVSHRGRSSASYFGHAHGAAGDESDYDDDEEEASTLPIQHAKHDADSEASHRRSVDNRRVAQLSKAYSKEAAERGEMPTVLLPGGVCIEDPSKALRAAVENTRQAALYPELCVERSRQVVVRSDVARTHILRRAAAVLAEPSFVPATLPITEAHPAQQLRRASAASSTVMSISSSALRRASAASSVSLSSSNDASSSGAGTPPLQVRIPGATTQPRGRDATTSTIAAAATSPPAVISTSAGQRRSTSSSSSVLDTTHIKQMSVSASKDVGLTTTLRSRRTSKLLHQLDDLLSEPPDANDDAQQDSTPPAATATKYADDSGAATPVPSRASDDDDEGDAANYDAGRRGSVAELLARRNPVLMARLNELKAIALEKKVHGAPLNSLAVEEMADAHLSQFEREAKRSAGLSGGGSGGVAQAKRRLRRTGMTATSTAALIQNGHRGGKGSDSAAMLARPTYTYTPSEPLASTAVDSASNVGSTGGIAAPGPEHETTASGRRRHTSGNTADEYRLPQPPVGSPFWERPLPRHLALAAAAAQNWRKKTFMSRVQRRIRSAHPQRTGARQPAAAASTTLSANSKHAIGADAAPPSPSSRGEKVVPNPPRHKAAAVLGLVDKDWSKPLTTEEYAILSRRRKIGGEPKRDVSIRIHACITNMSRLYVLMWRGHVHAWFTCIPVHI